MAAAENDMEVADEMCPTPEGEETNNADQASSNMAEPVVFIAQADVDMEERSIVKPGGGTLLEMQCTTHSNSDKGETIETYSSKLSENTKVENGQLVCERLYEESAEKCSREKDETGEEKNAISRLKYEESEKIRENETGNKVKQFSASKEEKIETSTTSVADDSGPSKRYLTKSRNSFSKSVVKHETLLDGNESPDVVALLTLRKSLLNDNSAGSYVSKAMTATGDKALESYSSTSSKSDYSENTYKSSEDSGAQLQIDSNKMATDVNESVDFENLEKLKLNAKMEAEDSVGLETTGEETMNSTSESIGKSDFCNSVETSEMNDKHEVSTSDIKENGFVASSTSSMSSAAHMTDDSFSSASSTSAIKSSATSDSGVGMSGKPPQVDFDHSARTDSDRSRTESPFSGPLYEEDRHSANELIKRILADSGLEPSPRPPRKVRVDMGDTRNGFDSASVTTDGSGSSYYYDDKDSLYGRSEERGVRYEQRQDPVGREKPSFFERRLEDVGVGKPTTVRDADPTHEGEVFLNEEVIYMKKRKPEEDIENDFEAEIRKIKEKYKHEQEDMGLYQEDYAPSSGVLQREANRSFLENENLQDSYSPYSARPPPARFEPEYDEGELDSVLRPRGRMMRQPYIDDEEDDGFRTPPPPPAEEYIPDEEFKPARRPETEEVVKEKTAEIKTVVDRQTSVLQKLRQASESFDDLSSEIRQIKQQFFENQFRRASLYDQEDDQPTPGYQDAAGAAGRYVRGSYGYSATFDQSSASRRSDQGYGDDYGSDVIGGRALGSLATLGYGQDSYRSGTAYGLYRRGQYSRNRSKSLYDDYTFETPSTPSSTRRSYNYGATDDKHLGGEEEATSGPAAGSYRRMSGSEIGGSYGLGTGYSSYSSRLGATSSLDTSSYSTRSPHNRRRVQRSNTLADFDLGRFSSSSAEKPFSSRFLNKVRENKLTGEESTTTKKDKPFKSRFLRKSFDSSYSSSSSSTRASSSMTDYAKTSASSGNTAESAKTSTTETAASGDKE